MSASSGEETKKQLVLDTIAEHCRTSSSSSPPIFRQINDALNGGQTLDAKILSGGITNFSYKVHTSNNDLTVFAKLSFEYALFNPDGFHDLARTENEYRMMERMAAATPDCVVAPLACWDVECQPDSGGKPQRGKILVTEWSAADEQFGNQFADGCVDGRVAVQLADTLATLHLMDDYDPKFNETVKPCFAGLLQMAKGVVEGLCRAEAPKDRTEAYCREVGWATSGAGPGLRAVMNANIADYDRKDCLIHGDAHVFNMLVEARPSIEQLEEFGPNGTMILCDWETCFAGPQGKDLGAALAGAIGCLVGHGLGRGIVEESIKYYIMDLMAFYFSRMRRAGKTEVEIAHMVRNAAGWAGWTQFVVFYFLGVQLDSFGVEGPSLQKYVRDAMGVLGLKLMRFGYDHEAASPYANSKEALNEFTGLYMEEVYRAVTDRETNKRRFLPRRSSILRNKSRRVSDAALHLLATDSVARELSGCSIAE
ncbi:hypothetical protein ACHAXT_005715 [Thalassiosira profunda]